MQQDFIQWFSTKNDEFSIILMHVLFIILAYFIKIMDWEKEYLTGLNNSGILSWHKQSKTVRKEKDQNQGIGW